VDIETTVYGTFKGADFSTDPSLVDKRRSPLCTNMAADGGGMPEKRPGWRTLHTLSDRINGLYIGEFGGETKFLAHAGTKLFRWDETEAEPAELLTGLTDGKSAGAAFGGKLWILTGGEYLVYDGATASRATADAYVPTTVIARDPALGGGTSYESLNLLSAFRKNSFQTDGTDKDFLLDGDSLDTFLEVGSAGIGSGTACYYLSGSTYYLFTASRDYAEGDILNLDFDALAVTCGNTFYVEVGSEGIESGTVCYFLWGSMYYIFTASRAYADGEILALDLDALTAVCGETAETLSKRTTENGSDILELGTLTDALTESVSAVGTDVLTLGTLTAGCAVTAEVWGEEKTEGTDFTVDRAAGVVTFGTAPAAPSAGSEDGCVITFPKTVEGYADRIEKCRIVTSYGVGNSDRLVFSGNPDFPNQDWTSGLLDPTYVPDLSYATIGLEGVPIMGYCRIGEYLAIVKEDNGQDSTVFLRSATPDADGQALFPVRQAIAGVGAVSRGSFAALLDEQLFLSGTGIYAVATNSLTSERVTQNRSFYINNQLTKEENPEEAEAVQFGGMYMLFLNSHVYLLDGRQQKSYRSESLGDYVYEGYYWDNVPARCVTVRRDGAEEHLYFGTADGGICRFNTDIDDMTRFSDDGAAISAVWATKADDDGDVTVLKTMLKKGNSVTIKPYTRTSAKVCFRTNRDVVDWQAAYDTMDVFDWSDIDFSRFTFNANDTPQEILFNAKVKNYKRLQILIRNDTADEGFGVFNITKHFVYGNFAKR
jgi:hypothetical protein